MLNKSYDEIVEKIQSEKGISKDDIERMVEDKMKQLADLVSREGAAHIIANQLGVKIFEEVEKRELKVKDIFAGMTSVNILVRVLNIYNIIEYRKEGRYGRVVSMLIGDETSVIRAVFWDENLIKKVEKNEIKPGDVLRIKNAYSRENNGFIEIHLGSKSQVIINPEGEVIRDIRIKSSRKRIEELEEGNVVEIFGTIVQVFEPRFYHACPDCNKKVNFSMEKAICLEHGEVISKKVPIVNLFLDDGSGSIRVVFFRDLAENLVNKKGDNLYSNFDDLRKEILGRQILITGKVVKNSMFDRLEFISNNFDEIDPLELLRELG